MIASNKLQEVLLPTYSDFENIDDKKVVGYKLCRKSNGNYYSLITGLFRYKERMVSYNSYHKLYQDEKVHYNEHLKDRVSIFKTKDDAIMALSNIVDLIDDETILCLIEITLIGDNIETAKYSNKYVDKLSVYVGPTMDKIKELEIIK